MKNYLYSELAQACAMEGFTLTQWAEKSGLSKAMPTDLKKGVRPGPETLKKLVHGWSVHSRGLRILEAYLKDEIERVGESLDSIQPLIKSDAATPQIDNDLDVIEAFISRAPKLRNAIHMTADLLRSQMGNEARFGVTQADIVAADKLSARAKKSLRPTQKQAK